MISGYIAGKLGHCKLLLLVGYGLTLLGQILIALALKRRCRALPFRAVALAHSWSAGCRVFPHAGAGPTAFT
jgi:hypothetical protein